MSTVNFGNAVKKFRQAGIKARWFIPVSPPGAQLAKNSSLEEKMLGKAPGRYLERSQSWTGLGKNDDGKAYVAVGLSKTDFDVMSEWPTGNAGVLGAAYPGIDSDAESREASDIVDRAVSIAFGTDSVIPIRYRGDNYRRLYAFKADPANPVPTRRIKYKLPGDDTVHGLDIQGHGTQYVVTGTHPSGDEYTWDGEGLDNADTVSKMLEIEPVDMDRFAEILVKLIEEAGGEILTNKASGTGENYDFSDLEPSLPAEAVLDGLRQLPNTPDTFATRDNLISFLASVRATLGRLSNDPEVENAVRDWACADESWCPEWYFDKIWFSFHSVRVSRDYFDKILRTNKITTSAKHVFDKVTVKDKEAVKKAQDHDAGEVDAIFDEIALNFVFGARENNSGNLVYVMLAPFLGVEIKWSAEQWWKQECPADDSRLALAVQRFDAYPKNKTGLNNFLRDLKEKHPQIFYNGETRHPSYDVGEIVPEEQPNGKFINRLNTRYISAVVRNAAKPDPDPQRSASDVAFIKKFGGAIFGEHIDYELDTLAYMVQNPGKRPGAFLFLVGDQGVGKSVWNNMQSNMFDGPGQSALIDGARLLNESARRFALAGIEGRRIVSIKELPENSNRASDMAAITSQLKQLVDPGMEGDFVTIERKGHDAIAIRNYARVVVSSNYANAVQVEDDARRIFYVRCGITVENKPPQSVYDRIHAIIQDPIRLAAFWRYLETRDVSKYNPASPPPLTNAKKEQQITHVQAPTRRHAAAALMWLTSNKNRSAFDTDELMELMTKCAKAEFLSGKIDTKVDYTKEEARKKYSMDIGFVVRKTPGVKKLDKSLVATGGKKRFPTVYVMNGRQDIYDKLIASTAREISDYANEEYERGIGPHPLEAYQLPEEE